MYSLNVLAILIVYHISYCISCEFRDDHFKDYTYLNETKSFYKLHKQRSSWLQANKTCWSEGATLFIPIDEREARIIQEWYEKCTDVSCPTDKSRIHIGITDLGHEGVFEAVDGTPIDNIYKEWSGNPNNDNGAGIHEDCVEILFNRDFKLNDILCDGSDSYTKIPFVCKKNVTSLAENNWDLKCIKNLDTKYHYHLASKGHTDVLGVWFTAVVVTLTFLINYH